MRWHLSTTTVMLYPTNRGIDSHKWCFEWLQTLHSSDWNFSDSDELAIDDDGFM